MPIDFDDFSSSNYEDFRDSFLIERKSGALDKPAPRATGEIEQLASKANINIANGLNRLLNNFKKKISYDHDFDVNLDSVPMGDWREGGAAILNITPKNSIYDGSVEISVNIYDNNNVSINVPRKVAELTRITDAKRYKGSNAIEKAYKDLKRIFKVISL